MKTVLAILILFSTLIAVSMNNHGALGGKIADNIVKLRQYDGHAGTAYQAGIVDDHFAAARQVQKVMSLTSAIPNECEQSKTVWHSNRIVLLKMSYIQTSAIQSAWQEAQSYCRSMPDL